MNDAISAGVSAATATDSAYWSASAGWWYSRTDTKTFGKQVCRRCDEAMCQTQREGGLQGLQDVKCRQGDLVYRRQEVQNDDLKPLHQGEGAPRTGRSDLSRRDKTSYYVGSQGHVLV